jgi:hypothetical protein
MWQLQPETDDLVHGGLWSSEPVFKMHTLECRWSQAQTYVQALDSSDTVTRKSTHARTLHTHQGMTGKSKQLAVVCFKGTYVHACWGLTLGGSIQQW